MKKTSFLLTSLAAATCLASATSARAATIVPKYDTAPAQQKYWTPAFKKQVQTVCDLLGGYINDNITIELAVTVGNTGGAFGTGAVDTTGAYDNSATKYRAKNGKITFNQGSFDDTKKEWNGNNTSLMLHEIIHCLGFSGQFKNRMGQFVGGISAFNTNVDMTNYTFKGANTKKVNGNTAYPLNGENDLSHFKRDLTPPVANQVVMDKVGVVPRMMAGGGNLLSIVDLAVLADLGYDIPVVKNATAAIALGFKLDNTFGSKYNSPQWGGATSLISGFAGDDTLTGDSESVALFGNGGSDTLITGSERTVMFGDNIEAFAAGFATGAGDNSDIYKITSKKEHLIVGLGAKDKIIIKTGVATVTELAGIKAELPGSVSVYTFSGVLYPTYKVTVGTLVFYVCYPLAYAKPANPQMLTQAERDARLKVNTDTLNALNTRLKACVSIGN